MLFSILIANYNNGIYLQECIDSVLQQTYTNWEVIIVDDYSIDNSKKIYQKYQDNPKFNISINIQNEGCGYTKRKCVELAKGEVCAFLDPDDTITPNALELIVKEFQANPDTSSVYSRLYFCDKNLKITSIREAYALPNIRGSYLKSTKPTISHFYAFKKYAYNKTSGINPTLKRAVDKDLYLKVDEVGISSFVDKPLYFYRRHERGISTAQNELKAKYWNAKVYRDTYERRKGTTLPNLSKREVDKYFVDYFLWKSNEKFTNRRYLSGYICLKNAVRFGLYRYHSLFSMIKLFLRPAKYLFKKY